MKNELTYTEKDGLLYPEIEMPAQKKQHIGKYGDLHRLYLKEHRTGTYSELLISGTLNDYLKEIDDKAHEYVRTVTAELAERRGINEEMKEIDALLWAQEMNNCKADAEEIVMREIVYR